jgi:proteic killer suppression protein
MATKIADFPRAQQATMLARSGVHSRTNSRGLERATGGKRGSLAALDEDKQYVYVRWVIRTFADAETRRFYAGGTSRRVPTEIRKRAAMRLAQLNAATRVEDLRMPPSSRLEQLHGNRAGQWSIRINDQWRVCH